MTWVKICGITNAEDAHVAAGAGADALGFVFAESPRRVTAAMVRAITAEVPSHITRVGVFVDESLERIMDAVVETGLTAVQLHGAETLDFARKLCHDLSQLSSPVKLIRATGLPVLGNGVSEALGWDPVSSGVIELDPHSATERPGVFAALVADACTPELRGGTGRTFDWHRSRALLGLMSTYTKVVVAGGLQPDNVTEAIELFHPWGVDVSSGVERERGKKDPEKVKRFVDAVRAAERRL